MSMPTIVRSVNVGGVAVDVFSTDWLCSGTTTDKNASQILNIVSTLPITVLVLLHGRTRDKSDMRSVAEKVLRFAREKTLQSVNGSEPIPSHELIVVTLDHRNHGARTVDVFSNQGWNKKPEEHNILHAIDMYAIQTGTAQEVSFLIDFLPSYLFPNGERTIDTWAVAGVSLGGHSTWHCLKDGAYESATSAYRGVHSPLMGALVASKNKDPRVTIGIPIIGCPDFLTLMTARARHFAGSTLSADNPTGPPAFPISLVAHITKTSPAPPSTNTSTIATAIAYSHTDLDARINPFIGKKILILSGAADRLVPWTASEKFVEALQVGPNGRKEVFVQEGVGHDCTEEMEERLAKFVWQESLARGVC